MIQLILHFVRFVFLEPDLKTIHFSKKLRYGGTVVGEMAKIRRSVRFQSQRKKFMSWNYASAILLGYTPVKANIM